MGQGGNLALINATPYEWKRVGQDKKNMDWDLPKSILPGQRAAKYVEFYEPFLGSRNDHAKTTYEIQMEGKPTFTVNAGWNHFNNEMQPRQIWIDLGDLIKNPGWITSPPLPKIQHIKWIHNTDGGTMTFTLAGPTGGGAIASVSTGSVSAEPFVRAEPRTLSQVKVEVEEAVRRFEKEAMEVGSEVSIPVASMATSSSRVMAAPPGNAYWMQTSAPQIGRLSASELVLPGAHDAGTYKMVSPVAGPWASTQNLSIRGLLDAGVRCLDLRVANDEGKYILVHNTWRTITSLEDALAMIHDFLQEHTQEIVVLDFHRFPELNGHKVDPDQVAAITRTKLGKELLLPVSEYGKPLSDVWQNQKGRVVALMNDSGDPTYFGPKLTRRWAGEDTKTREELEEFIKKNMGSGTPFWSIDAVLPAQWDTPVPHLRGQIDEWFQTGVTLMEHACVIYCDFVEETNLVNNCIGENLLRAAQKSA